MRVEDCREDSAGEVSLGTQCEEATFVVHRVGEDPEGREPVKMTWEVSLTYCVSFEQLSPRGEFLLPRYFFAVRGYR